MGARLNLCLNGVTRVVVLAGPWAIKLPRFGYGWAMGLRGLLCNMQERGFWAAGWEQLCPVLFALPGGWAIIMKRARPLTDEEWTSLNVDEFRKHRAREGDGSCDGIVPVEPKRDSFGVIDGRIVAVDYGS